MDWGLSNPNKTAVLIAMLMILAWSLTYIRRWGFWVALGCFIALGICLVHTVSRGGILALVSGSGIFLWKLQRPWNIPRTIAVVLGILLIVFSAMYLKVYSRYGQGVIGEDRSIENRWQIWRVAPQMMVDAPSGWGLGNSGHAYMQWYQPIGHHEKYRTLVNSHLTWLVEFSWPFRLLYLFVWFTVGMVCWLANKRDILHITPFAIWVAFGIGSCFSSVAESIWLWVVPVLSLVCALYYRYTIKCWPSFIEWLIPIGLSILSLVICILIGNSSKWDQIRGSNHEVIIGKGEPMIWIVVDPVVLGSDYGQTLRRNLPSCAIGLLTSPILPGTLKGNILFICGSLDANNLNKYLEMSSNFSEVVFVNPYFYPQEIKGSNIAKEEILFGQFSRSPAIKEWKFAFQRKISILSGFGDFLPNWPNILLNSYAGL